MNLNKNNIDKIIQFLVKNVSPYLIYLFGTGAKGIFREDSDVDIAFISDKKISDYAIFMLAQELADILQRDVDLAMHIVSEKKLGIPQNSRDAFEVL